ncbi:hypothetical protein CRYUN_Cryun05aG0192200 [Craigia yunnanensis]
MFVHNREYWRGMAAEVLPPPGKRPRITPDYIRSSTDISQPNFHCRSPSLPASASSMGKPVSFHPMQHQYGQGFFVNNPPNAGFNLVVPPIMVKSVPVQDFHPQHAQRFFPLQNQREQSCAVKLLPIDNTHPAPRPVAPVSSQVTFDQLSSAVLSELIQSIRAQGVAKPKEETLLEDIVPLEFDADWLKVRHESVIRSLSDDISRQCRTCGQRFKTQEKHSKHMDWHIRKNRAMKNKKVKSSRPWLLTKSLWLTGAEVLTGADNGCPPEVLRPRDSIVEMEKDEELAVLADEDQKICALCMEAFEDFYSDETEDWMYKGDVYMNVPYGSTAAGKDRSQLGPIVHAKCMPETTQMAGV